MMRALILATLMFWAATAQADSRWNALWHTPDQQGEQLLQNGHPAQAARVFHDPRHKAYAELEAGNYARAAKEFAAFHDSDSEYNRGNSLARSGDLEGAIKAYDAALASNPNNRDARHNRDLVAKALKKQKHKPQSKTGKHQGNSKKQSQGKDKGHGKGKSQGQGTNKGKNKPNDKGQSSAGNQHKAGKSHDQGAQTGSGQKTKDSAQTRKPSTGKKPASQNGRKQTVAASKAGKKSKQLDRADQARKDTTAAPGKTAQGSQQTRAPLSERQLAQKQWLRRISDDPGGLLRRKFMIEHMLRQEGKQP